MAAAEDQENIETADGTGDGQKREEVETTVVAETEDKNYEEDADSRRFDCSSEEWSDEEKKNEEEESSSDEEEQDASRSPVIAK